MVRLPIPKTSSSFPPKTLYNSNSNFPSTKQQCLNLLNHSSSLNHLSQIHAQILLSGLHRDSFIVSELIRFLALSPSKNLHYARTLLFRAVSTTPISWNLLIRAYSSSDTPRNAILVFRRMRREEIRPNHLTFPFLLKACAENFALREGKQVHVDVFKFGLDFNVYVNNNLVYFYGSCKKIKDSVKVFDEMPDKSLVSWNVVITTCVENLWFGEAIEYFVKLKQRGFEADETTMVVMLSLCTEMGNLGLGRWIHSQVIKREMVVNSHLGTALVDMYAKSGNVDYARIVFDRMEERNVWTWSAMILGLAQHGFALEGLEVFIKMKKVSAIKPNYVTFLGVLCACSHAGLVDEGFQYFHEMEHKHGIKPMMIHYGAMVDILGRAGHLKEAYEFIIDMPFQPDPIVWRTLLSACSVHDIKDKSGVAETVKQRLLELEPRRSGNFIMVANMYADTGMWDKAAKIRKVMSDGGLKKRGGESCVEISGSIHHFFSGYDSEDAYKDIYQLLDVLNLHMKMDAIEVCGCGFLGVGVWGDVVCLGEVCCPNIDYR